ncbi:MAG: histidine kinase [Oscillospiraceae bacterium]|nr:histidine kinase [Oscillospiraceae bacterium]
MKDGRQITSWGHVDWIPSGQLGAGNLTEIGIISLLPGKCQAEHTHYSENQFLYTLTGHGEHIIDGHRYPIAPGEFFFLPVGVTHTTTNLGDDMLSELMLSVPVHLSAAIPTSAAIPRKASSDPAFIRETLQRGVNRLARETLDHLNIPVVITDAEHELVYGTDLSDRCQGCKAADCPICCGVHELRTQSGYSCGSVTCPRGLSVLVQPVSVDGETYLYIKGGLIQEYGNLSQPDDAIYDVPGSTVNAIRIFLQDMNRYLQDFYLEKQIEREILLRDAAVAKEQSHSKALSEAFEQNKCNTLNIQIRNHFLFNSLNSIASLAIRDNSVDTYKAILDLAELLRGLLRREGARVPLSEELEFLQRYLRLQELRHEGTLVVRWNRCSAAENVIVPHNFLQPLAEDSFVHAFKDTMGVKELSVETAVEGGRASVRICDNGCGMDEETLRQLRVSLRSDAVHGLSMVWRKLSGVFGMDFSFDIDSAPGQGTCYHLTFPL